MKTLTTTLAVALAATLFAPVAFAQSADIDRAALIEKRRAAIALMRRNAGIDQDLTATVRSDNAYDARGVIVPNAEVTLGAGLAAKIESMPFKSGQRFRKGDTLVAFDCARQSADLRGANSALAKANQYAQTKQRLLNRGAAGAQEVREAKSDAETARASRDGLSELMTYCTIIAPFDGRVVERHAEAFEIPAPNAPVLTVVDDSALELDLIVPSNWLRWVQRGTSFTFTVDELGQTFDAKVARLGAKVDAVSQTIKLTGIFPRRPDAVLAGMSGTAQFEAPPSN